MLNSALELGEKQELLGRPQVPSVCLRLESHITSQNVPYPIPPSSTLTGAEQKQWWSTSERATNTVLSVDHTLRKAQWYTRVHSKHKVAPKECEVYGSLGENIATTNFKPSCIPDNISTNHHIKGPVEGKVYSSPSMNLYLSQCMLSYRTYLVFISKLRK